MRGNIKLAKKLLTITIAALFVSCFLMESTQAEVPQRNIVLVVWDGTERSVLYQMINNGQLPFISSLNVADLTSNLEYDAWSITRPQHASMLSGFYADITGITRNTYGFLPDGLSIFENTPSEYNVVGAVAKEENVADMLGFPQKTTYYNQNGFDYFDNTIGLITQSRQRILNIVNQTVSRPEPYSLFIHLTDIDDMGHLFSVNSTFYRQAIRQCDNITQQIYNLVKDTNPLFIVAGDHGFGSPNPRHHETAPNTFIACNYPLNADNAQCIDVAATYYSYLQIPMDKAINGKSIVSSL